MRLGRACKRPARSAGAPSHSAAAEACTPAAQITRPRRAAPGRHRSRCRREHSVTACRARTSTPSFSSALRIGRQLVGKSGSTRGPASTSMTRALRVSMLRNSRGQRVLRQFDDGAGQLDAGRPAADDDEGQQRPRSRIGLALRAFEGEQHAAPNRGRVLQRLQARRQRLPFVMAEIGVARAGGEHEVS